MTVLPFLLDYGDTHFSETAMLFALTPEIVAHTKERTIWYILNIKLVRPYVSTFMSPLQCHNAKTSFVIAKLYTDRMTYGQKDGMN